MPLQHPMVHGAMMLPAPTGMSNALAETLTISNYIFTGLFTMEMILKLFALGFFEYVADSFNIFDGVVVVLSIVEIILDVSMLIQCSLCTPCPALLRPVCCQACQYRLLWQVYTFVSLMPSLSACVLLLHALCTGMQMVYVSPR